MNYIDWDEEQTAVWNKWVASRPPVVREMITRLPANRLYRIKSSGQRGTIFSYNENGTVNLVMFGRAVFGLSPDALEECDLPYWLST